jgi:hypothetical protein
MMLVWFLPTVKVSLTGVKPHEGERWTYQRSCAETLGFHVETETRLWGASEAIAKGELKRPWPVELIDRLKRPKSPGP